MTYVSNQELGFDFLRDNLALSVENVVQQRPYNFCVVDEADSILIDEARTPLIISRKVTYDYRSVVLLSSVTYPNLHLSSYHEW